MTSLSGPNKRALIVIDMQKCMADAASGVRNNPDATFAFARQDYNGTARSADDVHVMSLANMQGEYAEVVTSEELINAP